MSNWVTAPDVPREELKAIYSRVDTGAPPRPGYTFSIREMPYGTMGHLTESSKWQVARIVCGQIVADLQAIHDADSLQCLVGEALAFLALEGVSKKNQPAAIRMMVMAAQNLIYDICAAREH